MTIVRFEPETVHTDGVLDEYVTAPVPDPPDVVRPYVWLYVAVPGRLTVSVDWLAWVTVRLPLVNTNI